MEKVREAAPDGSYRGHHDLLLGPMHANPGVEVASYGIVCTDYDGASYRVPNAFADGRVAVRAQEGTERII